MPVDRNLLFVRCPIPKFLNLIEFKLIAGLGSRTDNHSRRQFQRGMRYKTSGKPPRYYGTDGFFHFALTVQINDVNREFHEKRMNSLAGNDPKPFAGLQTLPLQQARPAQLAGIGKLDRFAQKRILSKISNTEFQSLLYNTRAPK